MSKSVGYSRPIKHLRNLTQRPHSIKNSGPKAAHASSSHSYQTTIKELMNIFHWPIKIARPSLIAVLCRLMAYIRVAGTAVEEHTTYFLDVISVH